ncbi:MAG: tryptophan--tRNA ligase [Pseudomonadota bacterium]
MTDKPRSLTGITTTGTPHLGNYVGAIRPSIEDSRREDTESFYFLADYHALIKCDEPARVHQSTLEIAATWLALGLNTHQAVFYRQSDIPEIPELTWVLGCICAKGLMNRAHAYKAAVQDNESAGEDPDHEVTMGLFSYPVLMAADILMFNATHVPVGKDQVQHLEMARDMAQRFNHRYGEVFALPAAVVDETAAVLPGLDGRKMSKSYDNAIPLWLPEKKLRKAIMKIVTNSKEPGEPKGTDESALFPIYAAFVGEAERQSFADELAAGMAWGAAKQVVFERINHELAPARERYAELIENPDVVEQVLQTGAARAREQAAVLMADVRQAVGIRPLPALTQAGRA